MNDGHQSGTAAFTVEDKFRLLLEISEKISGTLDLDELLGHLVDTLRSVVHYDAAGIYVIKRNGEPPMIESMVTRGFDGPDVEHDLLLKFGEGIVGFVIEAGQSIIIPEVQNDPRYVMARRRTRSEITAPITLNERVIGAFNIESDRPDAFTGEDVEVLQFFANAAARRARRTRETSSRFSTAAPRP